MKTIADASDVRLKKSFAVKNLRFDCAQGGVHGKGGGERGGAPGENLHIPKNTPKLGRLWIFQPHPAKRFSDPVLGMVVRAARNLAYNMAERVGFEPTYRLITGNSISSRARYGRFATSPVKCAFRLIGYFAF